MPEPFTITTLLLAGAAAAGSELVKEGTKDAYRKLKDKVGELFGPRAAKAIVKLGDTATQEEGKKDVWEYCSGARSRWEGFHDSGIEPVRVPGR